MNPLDEKTVEAVQQRAKDGRLGCADAFQIAGDLAVSPSMVGRAADALDVRLARCQLGLFGYGERKRIIVPAESVTADLEQAIREGLILGRLPCAVAWAIAVRFGIPRLEVASAAEKLGISLGQCQLGAF